MTRRLLSLASSACAFTGALLLIAFVLAARVLALARPGESIHVAARRLLGVAVEEESRD